MPNSEPADSGHTPGALQRDEQATADDAHASGRSLPATLYSTAIDLRNEAIAQSASLYLKARWVLLTSLGAIALTIEETNELVELLVQRGEVAGTELTRIVSDYVEQSNAREREAIQMRRATIEKASAALADSVEVILGRLNVPTRSDIEDLSKRIKQLNEKVAALKEQRATTAQAAPQQPPTAALGASQSGAEE